MKRYSHIIFFVSAALLLFSCGDADSSQTNGEKPATGSLAMIIQKQARVYSTEYRVRKIITYDDTRQLEGKLLGKKFSIGLPLGKRSIAIPIEATIKAFVDFKAFDASGVRTSGKKIEIILPDPEIEMTSTKIIHDEVRQHVAILRANFTDEELSRIEHDGREAIANDLPSLDITETARKDAARALIPMLAAMGFDENDITITFRHQLTGREMIEKIMQ